MSNYDDIFANSQNENQVENAHQEFNKEDWIAKKQIEREQTYTMMNDMTEKVASEPEAFKQFLDIQSRFDRFSVGNVMLIASQMPEAKRLGDYEYWAEQGEYVKKGSEAISILEPGNEYTREDGSTAISMNVKKVFDISQTGAEIKDYKMVKGLNDFRNDLIQGDKPTEDIDELLLKVIKAPTKKEKRKLCHDAR